MLNTLTFFLNGLKKWFKIRIIKNNNKILNLWHKFAGTIDAVFGFENRGVILVDKKIMLNTLKYFKIFLDGVNNNDK